MFQVGHRKESCNEGLKKVVAGKMNKLILRVQESRQLYQSSAKKMVEVDRSTYGPWMTAPGKGRRFN